MLLAIDVGNSDVVIGAFDSKHLVKQWRVSTSKGHYLDVLEEDAKNITAVIIGSVVPQVTEALVAAAREALGLEPFVVHPHLKDTGVTFGDIDPSGLGADLFVNAVAIYHLFGKDCLSVDLGTGSTFCVISSDGLYKGTTIVPGMQLSLQALTSRAPLIPPISLQPTERVINTDTISCLQSGIFYGYSALVDGLVEKIKAEQGDLYVVLTGGIGTALHPFLHNIDEYVPDLTLQGLQLVYELVFSNTSCCC